MPTLAEYLRRFGEDARLTLPALDNPFEGDSRYARVDRAPQAFVDEGEEWHMVPLLVRERVPGDFLIIFEHAGHIRTCVCWRVYDLRDLALLPVDTVHMYTGQARTADDVWTWMDWKAAPKEDFHDTWRVFLLTPPTGESIMAVGRFTENNQLLDWDEAA